MFCYCAFLSMRLAGSIERVYLGDLTRADSVYTRSVTGAYAPII